MIVIYERGDMIERAKTKPANELSMNDIDPRSVANPTIYIAADGIARKVSGSKQDATKDFEITIVELQ